MLLPFRLHRKSSKTEMGGRGKQRVDIERKTIFTCEQICTLIKRKTQGDTAEDV